MTIRSAANAQSKILIVAVSGCHTRLINRTASKIVMPKMIKNFFMCRSFLDVIAYSARISTISKPAIRTAITATASTARTV